MYVKALLIDTCTQLLILHTYIACISHLFIYLRNQLLYLISFSFSIFFQALLPTNLICEQLDKL